MRIFLSAKHFRFRECAAITGGRFRGHFPPTSIGTSVAGAESLQWLQKMGIIGFHGADLANDGPPSDGILLPMPSLPALTKPTRREPRDSAGRIQSKSIWQQQAIKRFSQSRANISGAGRVLDQRRCGFSWTGPGTGRRWGANTGSPDLETRIPLSRSKLPEGKPPWVQELEGQGSGVITGTGGSIGSAAAHLFAGEGARASLGATSIRARWRGP